MPSYRFVNSAGRMAWQLGQATTRPRRGSVEVKFTWSRNSRTALESRPFPTVRALYGRFQPVNRIVFLGLAHRISFRLIQTLTLLGVSDSGKMREISRYPEGDAHGARVGVCGWRRMRSLGLLSVRRLPDKPLRRRRQWRQRLKLSSANTASAAITRSSRTGGLSLDDLDVTRPGVARRCLGARGGEASCGSDAAPWAAAS